MSKYLVYSLSDPRTEEIRYVGQSSRGMIRPKQPHAAHCRSWELNLLEVGLKPEVEVLEEWDGNGDPVEWLNQTEIFWIATWRFMGAALTNLTDGGAGRSGFLITEHERQKRRETTIFRFPINLGRKHTEEEKLKRANSLRGKKRTQETRKKMSETRKQKAIGCTPVVCVNDGKSYRSIGDAASAYGLCYNSVYRVLRGQYPNVKGYSFMEGSDNL